MREWYVELGHEGQLATWLVVSFLLYTLASQLAWQLQWLFANRHSQRGEGRGRWTDLVHDRPTLILWAREAMRFIYYLGIPFLAATSGAIGTDLLGIRGTDWVEGKSAQGFLWEDWARGAGLATAAVLSIGGVWLLSRLLSSRSRLAPLPLHLPGAAWQRLLNALYDQVHWAFYRSGPILWLDDVYWGVFVGLALVLFQASLNPAHRWALKDPETAAPPLIRLGIAWISALIFLATHNLWLTLAAHLTLAMFLGWKGSNDHHYSGEPA